MHLKLKDVALRKCFVFLELPTLAYTFPSIWAS